MIVNLKVEIINFHMIFCNAALNISVQTQAFILCRVIANCSIYIAGHIAILGQIVSIF